MGFSGDEFRTARFPGTLDSLGPIGQLVLQGAERAGLEPAVVYRLRLAVDEVATNIVLHGYAEARLSGDIQVSLRLDFQAFTITLEDDAEAYDPTAQVLPTAEQLQRPLEGRDLGGLGIYLARTSVDEFRYERAGEKNRTTLVVKRRPGSEP
jgi:serine/threonine-protein kinase RsbW